MRNSPHFCMSSRDSLIPLLGGLGRFAGERGGVRLWRPLLVRCCLCPLYSRMKFQQSTVFQLNAVNTGLDALNAKQPPLGIEQFMSFPAPLSPRMRPSAAPNTP